jgi:hypothetical protein
MEQIKNILFVTYLLKQSKPEFEVRCCGCREIIVPEYKTPVHIMGVIKSEENFIPVIDPRIWFRGEPTRLTNSACILIVEHSYEYRQLRTGILISDIEELMNIIAGSFEPRTSKKTTFNIRFILELPGNTAAEDFLADCHIQLDMAKERKCLEDDFAAFKKIVLRGVAYA